MKYIYIQLIALLSLGVFYSKDTTVSSKINFANSVTKTTNFATFTVSTETTPAPCNSDGAVKFLIENDEANVDFQISIYRQPDLTNPVTVLIEEDISSDIEVVANLAAATYRAEISKINASGVQETTLIDFTIESEATTPIDFSVTSSYMCPTATDDYLKFRVKTESGTLVQYSAYDSDGNLVAGPQTSNVLENLEPGSYTIQVVSDCGAIRNENFVADELKQTYNYNSTNLSITTECNKSGISFELTSSDNILMYPAYAKTTITYPDGSTEVITETKENPINSTIATNRITFNNVTFDVFQDENTIVDIELQDACGKNVSFSKSYTYTNNPNAVIRQGTADCKNGYISFGYTSNMTYPLTATLTSFPSNFNLQQILDAGFTDNGDSTYSKTISSSTEFRDIVIGSSEDPVANGVYIFDFIDSCGNKVQKSPEIETGDFSISIFQRHYCSPDTFYISGYIIGGAYEIQVTKAPEGFPHELPYTLNQYETLDGTNRFYIYDAIHGDYEFQGTITGCENQIVTKTYTTTNQNFTYTSEAHVTRYCGNFGIEGSRTSVPGDNNTINIDLEKFNIETSEWERKRTLTTRSGNFSVQNLSFGNGKYRVISKVSNPPSEILEIVGECEQYEILEEFEFNGDTSVIVNDYYVNECIDGSLNVFIDAEGAGEINYSIVSKDGEAFSVDNGNVGLFENLEQGDYVFNLQDDCNTVPVSILANRTKEPRIRAYNLCEGENGKLFAPDLEYMSYEWTKDGDPTILSTTSELPIDNFSITNNSGVYQAIMTYTPNPNDCSEIVMTYNVTEDNISNPEAGTGQTITIAKDNKTVLDLFEYIDGDYDTFGYWEETTATSSGGLVYDSENWEITNVPSGTYTFLYTVDGGCSGTDTTTVTITLIACQDPILTIGDLSCDENGYTVSFISNGDTITASAGNVNMSTNSITGVPFGSELTITATNGTSCQTSQSISIPETCPIDCAQTGLTAGQAVCDGSGAGTFTVSYTKNTVSTLEVTGGTDNGDGTVTGNIGTDVILTATSGDCATVITVASPNNCDNPCELPQISIGGTTCSDDLLTYSVSFSTSSDATVSADQGTVNTATNTITDIPAGTDVTITSSFDGCSAQEITIPAPDCTTSDIKLLKDGAYQDTNNDGIVNVGDSVIYTFTVTNTGETTLSNITITDDKVTVQGGPIATLAVGASDDTTFSATYAITQEDIDAGGVYNLATVTGDDPDGTSVTDTSEDPTPVNPTDPNNPPVDPTCPDCTITPLPTNSSIELLKDGAYQDTNNDGIVNVGDSVIYTFTVTNTGETTLSNITITDDKVTVQGGPIATLAVGASDDTTFSATYAITQEDIDAGGVYNLATVTGDDPD
ncbi:DUF7507 domain-containing protein, partial [Joostella sp. CR20]|uniref:DUF7507 domain-containing protein n=1 Tax=Joostella sp. CR20 TaxID=2804312 RepID=UPI00313FB90F